MPRAASKEIEPVEMTAMGTMASLLPSRMIEPFPNCFSIWARARSIALVFSSTMFSPMWHTNRKVNIRPHLSVLIEDPCRLPRLYMAMAGEEKGKICVKSISPDIDGPGEDTLPRRCTAEGGCAPRYSYH